MSGNLPDATSKAEWLAYYSRKRVIHQWTQLYLLGATDCQSVLEIGPALGFVTSLLVNIGYHVTTLDRGPRSFAYPDVPYLEKDICELRSDDIGGYDAILCCETLEHIAWERVGSVLAAFRQSGAKYLIVSVPYMGFQVFVELYANSSTLRQYFSMKKLLWRKDFQAELPGGHQWEIGYRGYPLKLWEKRLDESGWSILRRHFTEHCRSVFHLLKAR
ncbi:MAG: class I SAM-dependent methyltransferase [Alphaproteobacteria bacterium]|nr:class I SAM-dependent methyltransferase [Alphaproteobacteria bacterium]